MTDNNKELKIDINVNEENPDKLIMELIQNRKDLYLLKSQIDGIMKQINIFLPKNSSDFKNRYIMQENIKSLTEVIKTKLDVHKTIESSIKSEADLRKKVKELNTEVDEEDFDFDNIAEIARQMEELSKTKIDDTIS